MARQLSSIDPEPQYRAVTLLKHSGPHDLPMRTYTDTDGNTYEYHRVYVFGPYEKPGSAKGMLKREERNVELGYRDYYAHSSKAYPLPCYEVSEFKSILEESTPVWGLHSA